ncbi:MAG: Rieske 2Fe-2S domain-containing protein [Spirochaetia bacterium]|nr:Rieske 2Fe-2S domain-containing protein [Spirochaetia bacterium]
MTKQKVTWTEIANVSEFSGFNTGDVVPIEVEQDTGIKHSIILVKCSDKEWFALDNLCTHDNGPLDDGEVHLKSCAIECKRHGAQFNIKNGQVVRMPAIHPVDTYPLKIENQILYIQLQN